jgi:cytochrome c oxidase subunit 4
MKGNAPHHATARTYVAVAVILTLITALEFGVIYIRRLAPVIVPLLLVMSTAKFALVVLFFMHLRYEGRSLTVLFVGPLVVAISLGLALLTLYGEFLVLGR